MKKFVFSFCILFFTAVSAQTDFTVFIEKVCTLNNKKLVAKKLDSLYKNTKKFNPETEILLLAKLGDAFFKIGEYRKMGIYAVKGLELSTKHNYHAHEAELFNIYASFQYMNDKNELAVENYRIALQKLQQYNPENKKLEISIRNNFGGLLTDIGKIKSDAMLEEGEYHLNKVIELSKTDLEHYSQYYIMSMRILATALVFKKQYDKANLIFDELLSFTREKGDSYTLTSVLTYYAESKRSIGQFEKALQLMEEAEKSITKEPLRTENTLVVYLNKARLLYEMKRFEEAADLYRTIYEMRTEITNEANKKEILELETQYKLNEAKTQAALEKEKRLQNLYLLIGSVLVLALVILALFVRNIRNKNKAQKEILNAHIQSEERERVRIARELHDGVVQDLTAISLNLEILDKLSESKRIEKLNKLKEYTQTATVEARNLSHRMMPIALRKHGLKNSLDDLLNKTLTPTPINYTFEAFLYSKQFSEDVQTGIYRIVQELVNNAVKHSRATQIYCSLKENEKNLELTFKDNGTGIPPEKQNDAQSGIGLESLRHRIEFLNGTFEMKNENGLVVKAIVATS